MLGTCRLSCISLKDTWQAVHLLPKPSQLQPSSLSFPCLTGGRLAAPDALNRPCKMSTSIHASQQPTNVEELQDWNADGYRQDCFFVPTLGKPVVELLAPVKGERVLDLGCGEGMLTKELVQAGCIVTAVDSSDDMVRLAQADGLDAHVMDGQDLRYEAEFDAVFSNAALHWMSREPPSVVAGVKRALKPGGRFVAECGGFGNCAALTTAALAALKLRGIDGRGRIPWFFPTPEEYRALLEQHGFHVEYMELIPRPTPLPAGMANWFDTFGDNFFRGMSPEERREATADAVDFLNPSLCSREGKWVADYVRLRFRASIPAL